MVQPGGTGKDESLHPRWKPQRKMQRHRRAHGNAADEGTPDLEVIHESEQVLGKVTQADLLGISQRRGRAVATTIKGQQTNIRRRLKQTERLLHIAAQSVLKEKRMVPVPFDR